MEKGVRETCCVRGGDPTLANAGRLLSGGDASSSVSSMKDSLASSRDRKSDPVDPMLSRARGGGLSSPRNIGDPPRSPGDPRKVDPMRIRAIEMLKKKTTSPRFSDRIIRRESETKKHSKLMQ